MAKDRPPSLQWYPRDFAAAVAGMSDSHELAYRRALDQSWVEEAYGVGSEADWKRWCRATDKNWPALRLALLPHVEVQPNGDWAQIRMARTRMEQEIYRTEQGERGRRGMASRWGNRSVTPADNAVITNDNSASASASALDTSKDRTLVQLPLDVTVNGTESPTKAKPVKNLPDPVLAEWMTGFEPLYQRYPRHVARRDAEKAYKALKPKRFEDCQPLFTRMLGALRADCEEWAREHREPRLIPHPATWINRRTWED